MRLSGFFAALLVGCSGFGATFGTVVTLLGGASDLVLDEARGRLYLVNSNSNRIEVYSTTQRRYLNPIATSARPLSAAMSRTGKFLYVSSFDQSSLNVIDLDTSTVVRRVSLPARPEGVGVGADDKVLITTIGTGQNNAFNTLVVFDPNAAVGAEISPVLVTPSAPAPPVAPPLGRTALATRSALLATQDGRYIIGVNNTTANTRSVFVYEAASTTILNARTFNFVSNVLSISPDGSKFMAGLTLFETSTLSVLAQQNAANAPFSFPGGNANNFNTQQNQGGSVFSPDGSVIYSAFNIAPVQNPPARPNVSRLLVNDPDNLLINLGLQLTENLAGKMVISSDGGTVYALSESGFVIVPVSQIYQNPIAMPTSPVVLLANDQCGVAPNRSAAVPVNNAGAGRMSVSAQLLQLPPTGVGGLGGFGGPGGGGPGGGIIIILPPTIPGGGGGGGTFGGGIIGGGFAFGNQAAIAQTSPLVQATPSGNGANITFQFNPAAARSLGTVPPHNFLIQSAEAINIPPNVKVFQNNRDSDARAQLMPIPVNAADNEGLFDMLMDNARQRLYIANSGLNRVEVFDMRARKFLAPIKVGQLPHSLAFGTDGATMYVANSGSETLSVVDLEKGQQAGLVHFPPVPFNSNVALVTPNVIAAGQHGPQVVMSNGSLWKVVGNQVLPRKLNPAVFGTATTVSGPTQTMVSTPGGEYILLLAGNGFAYVYDSSVDDWVVSRQLFGPANQTGLEPATGYYGPVGAGPRGQYFLANGLILNQSLTPIGSAPTQAGPIGPGGGLPGLGTQTVSRPVAAVTSFGNTTFVRFTQPIQTNTQALPAATDTPAVEMVDVNTGLTMRSAAALEGPLARVTGNQTQRVSGRTMAVDPSGTTAFALTTSGLSVVPLNPVAPTDRPFVNPNGVVSTASYLPNMAPGSLISLFGRNMTAQAIAPSKSLPAILGGGCVTLNNRPLPLIMTSDTQINAQIPTDLAAGRYPLIVRSIDRLAASFPSLVTVSRYAPAVFVNGDGLAAIYHKDGTLVSKDAPASRDEPLTLFATGLGVTHGGTVLTGQPAPNNPLAVTGKVQVFFGNPSIRQAEVIVDWSGLVPGFIGLNQLNLRVPGAHVKGDTLPVTLRIGGVSSPASGPAVPTVAVD